MAQTKPKAGQFYGVSNNGTDGEFLQTDGTGGMAWASAITNPTITSVDYPGTQTAADPAGGESVIINGTLFASGITCTVGGTSAVTAFNSSTQITITTPAKAAGPYTVAVTNTDGGTVSENNFIQYSGVPVWSTAAGTLGNVLEGAAASFQVTATEGSDTIEYAVTTGTLPTGLSLATATGAITGTAPAVSADTTTTFSITATDDENQTSASRSFSITVQNDAPSNHFNTVLYSGNGGTQSITGLNFSPGLVWIKKRNATEDHAWFDTVRGTQQQISSNLSAAEYTTSNAVSSFNSDGFTTGNNGATNNGSGTYVAWNFKAGGAAVANTDGTINSQVSVNNTLGFSIVKYTGNGNASADVGHGLSSIPELTIFKQLSSGGTGGGYWNTYYTANNTVGFLNQTNSFATNTGGTNGSVDISNMSTTKFGFLAGSSSANNQNNSGSDYIVYAFKSKPGFSKVGSYTGTGVSGHSVVTGFEPAWLMVKRTDSTGAWNIQDNKRNTSNPRTSVLQASSNDQEYTSNSYAINFLANGFQIVNSDNGWNTSGGSYIYLAFAADGSTTTPSLANSFATELYTGNGGTQSITTGFKPDWVWLKERSGSQWHSLYDSIRGVGNRIVSNSSNAENFDANRLTSFNSNGFSIGSDGDTNTLNDTYVSWNWKAGGTPSINTDGSTTSLVSANQAAGFSIVKFSGNLSSAGNIQVGHGLNVAPELIIQKNINGTGTWWARPFFLNSNPYQYLGLSESATLATSSSSDGTMSIPTSTTFDNNWNTSLGSSSGTPIIAYCFTSISGYSKVGSYTGLGSGGPLTVNVGFAPTLGIIKRTDSTGGWRMFDTVRGTDKSLRANSADAEYDDTNNYMDFTTTGFYFSNSQTNPDINAAGGTYIYLAIKEN